MPPHSRRGFLTSAAAAAGAVAGARAAAAVLDSQPSSPRIDLSSPEARLRVYARMIGSLDGRLVMSRLQGRYYGMIEGRMVPFYGVISVGFARTRFLSSGVLEIVSAEQAYNVDLRTGAPLDTWRNPVTGEVLEVVHVTAPPRVTHVVATAGGTDGIDLRHALDPVAFRGANHEIYRATQQADDVLFFERAEIPVTPGQPGGFVYNEMMVMRASARDLSDPSLPRAPYALGTYSAVQDGFRSWHRMGPRAGQLIAHGVTTHGVGATDLPPEWLERTRRVRPVLVDDPARELAALWSGASP